MRALSNRIIDALDAEGRPMLAADIAVTLREPLEAVGRTLARLPPGEVERDGEHWARPGWQAEAPPPAPAEVRWLPCSSLPAIGLVCYRGGLVLGGVVADRDIWHSRDDHSDIGEMDERVRWYLGAGHALPVTGYAPDAASARKAVEACAEALGFQGVGADGAVWEAP